MLRLDELKDVEEEGTYLDVKNARLGEKMAPEASKSATPNAQPPSSISSTHSTPLEKTAAEAPSTPPTHDNAPSERKKSTESAAQLDKVTAERETTQPEKQPKAPPQTKVKDASPMEKVKQPKKPKESKETIEDVNTLPTVKNQLYNIRLVLSRLDEYPMLKIRKEGKYYLSKKNVVVEKQPKVLRTKSGKFISAIRTETLGPIEKIFMSFCEDVLCISRSAYLPLSAQGERHLIWVGRVKAKHIIKFLKGNGCYIVNRFPGDIFLKDKQVMAVTLRQYMLEARNRCFWRCGAPKDESVETTDSEDENEPDVTFKICRHMVRSMRTDKEGCTTEGCFNNEKRLCKHFDIFIPEVQSFSSYNALQDFSNRLRDDLRGQMFICKPSYLYKGLGFRFFRKGADFEEFYHMTIGKDTSRHDFMVQRVINDPYLYHGHKVDIRAFLLIVTLRYRRVVAFVNYGFCRLASAKYKLSKDADDDAEAEVEEKEPLKPKQDRQRRADELLADMQMIVCPYLTDQERADRAMRMAENRLFTDEEDRSKRLEIVFRSNSLLNKVKKQIKHIATRLAEGIEKKIWDAYGCYQIFGLDLCVDEKYKVWLIEANSHAMSEVDMLSPTQRVVVPAVIMEALGLVTECMYKSSKGLRLRKSPLDEFQETGFLFGQNYEMVFSTLKRRRTDYKHPRPTTDNGPPFYERIAVVDELIRRVNRRKEAHEKVKQRLHEENEKRKKRRKEKDEEES